MTYYGYEIDPSYISDGKIVWVFTGNGELCKGTKNGKMYFIKRNIHVRYPARDLPRAAFETYLPPALALEKKQKSIKNAMKALNTLKDRIVVEEEHFWDSDNMLTTVTLLIPDILPDDYDFKRLSAPVFIEMAKDFAKRLEILHSCKIIHGDLKEKNVLVKQTADKKYETFLVDFDTSYPFDAIPDFQSIGGTEGYQSPEILAYASGSEEFTSDIITSATDIFTAALVLHKWWKGVFPGTEFDDSTCVGIAAYMEKRIDIDEKFNVKIGSNCGATLMSLLNWMLAKERTDRPTATQVYAVLNDELPVPEKYHKGSDEKLFDTTPWSIHNLVISILSEDELKKLGVSSFRRVNEGKGNAGLKYRVVGKDGKEQIFDAEGLVSAGYAKIKVAEIEEPWSDHEIEFESPEIIASKGYVRIRKAPQLYKHRYNVTLKSGLEIDKSREWLIAEGLAHFLVRTDLEMDTPWPEHGTEYVVENMTHFGIIKISRVEIGGEHRYRVVYDVVVDGVQKVNEKVSGNNMKLMGLIR